MQIVFAGAALGGLFQFFWMLYIYKDDAWLALSNRQKIGEASCGFMSAFFIGLLIHSEENKFITKDQDIMLLAQGMFGLLGAWALKLAQDFLKGELSRRARQRGDNNGKP